MHAQSIAQHADLRRTYARRARARANSRPTMRIACVCVLLGLAQADAFSFLSIGDWGDSAAKEVSPAMGKFSPDFVLALGDNFYDDGVSGVEDPQFKDKFEDTFTAPSLQVPWYVCAGNHDDIPIACAAGCAGCMPWERSDNSCSSGCCCCCCNRCC